VLNGKTGNLAAILKIQDGRHVERILVITIGFPIPENMGIDTKIMSLCGLEVKLEGHIGVFGGHFEICKLGAFPPLRFLRTFSMSTRTYSWVCYNKNKFYCNFVRVQPKNGLD